MTDDERTVNIAVAGDAVTAIEVKVGGDHAFVFAPGAGSNVNDPFGRHLCRALAEAGVSTLRIQFPYQEAGRKSPDRLPVLEGTWRSAIDSARPLARSLIVGGRSMGGRIASQVVAAGERVDSLVLFAYPLHPPGKPEQRRDEHLCALPVPVLFISGTRDAFASPEELQATAANIKDATVHLLNDADHGLNVPKSSDRKREDVWQEATAATRAWLGL